MKKRYVIIFVVQLFMFFMMLIYAVMQKAEAHIQRDLREREIERAAVSERQYLQRIEALENELKKSK